MLVKVTTLHCEARQLALHNPSSREQFGRRQQVAGSRPKARSVVCTRSVEPAQQAVLSGAGRRTTLLTLLSGAAAVLSPPTSSADELQQAGSELVGVDADLEARLTNQEVSWPFPGLYESQVFYPDWLFGEWDAGSRLTAFTMPRGPRLAPAEAAQAAQLDLTRVVPYPIRFYSTLPDTFRNNALVNLGLVPESRVIADRAFNTRALTNAVLGFEAVAYAEYDTRKPAEESIVFSSLSPDLRPLRPQRAELFISNLRSSALPEDSGDGYGGGYGGGGYGGAGGAGAAVFRCAECFRQVMVGVRSVTVRDYEIVSRYTRLADGRVALKQRVAVFLSPQDDRYLEAPGVSIALYEYDIELTRRTTAMEGGGARAACVPTPKGVVQCV